MEELSCLSDYMIELNHVLGSVMAYNERYRVSIECSLCKNAFSSKEYCKDGSPDISVLLSYNWQCPTCTSCMKCNQKGSTDQNAMIFCDRCDRGYHQDCVRPRVYKIPAGKWVCKDCDMKIQTIKMASLLHSDDVDNDAKHPLRRNDRSAGAIDNNYPIMKDKKRMKTILRVKAGRWKKPVTGTLKLTNSLKRKPVLTFESSSDVFSLNQYNYQKKSKISKVNESEYMSKPISTPIDLTISDCDLKSKKTIPFPADTCSLDMKIFEKVNEKKREREQLPISFLSERWVTIGDVRLQALSTDSPLPPQLLNKSDLYFCDVCLKMCGEESTYRDHMSHCDITSPPGTKIYEDAGLQIHEVDGAVDINYTQRLCLFARHFLTSKSLCYDVHVMLFYVLTRIVKGHETLIGYFSREKDQNSRTPNLSCILVLPQHSNQGFGKMLIDLSYIISRREEHPGAPEHPLSPAGLAAYTGYWVSTISHHLKSKWNEEEISIQEIAEATGIAAKDILETLVRMDLIKTNDASINVLFIAKPDRESKQIFEDSLKKYKTMRKQGRTIKEEKLLSTWLPPRLR